MPFAVGSLWLAAVALALYPSRNALADNEGVQQISSLLESTPLSLRVAAAGFGAYLLGIVISNITKASVGPIRKWHWTKWLIALAMKIPVMRVRRSIFRAGMLLRPVSEETQELLSRALRARLDKHLAGISEVIPPASLWEQEDLAEFRLSREAPEQFGIYDRTRSEAEFRAGIALPLVVLGVVIAWLTGWWWLLIGVAISVVVLIYQSIVLDHQARQLLVTSLALGYTSMPFLDEIENLLASRDDVREKVQGLVRLYLHEPGAGYLHYLLGDVWQVLEYRPFLIEMRQELPEELRQPPEEVAVESDQALEPTDLGRRTTAPSP